MGIPSFRLEGPYLALATLGGGEAIRLFIENGNFFRSTFGISELVKVKEFTPSKGSVIFFQSTPNSYHGVSLFREIKGKKRFFIYGSYALSKPVVWRYKNVSYLPKIKRTNKRMLTSSHDSDYLMREVG